MARPTLREGVGTEILLRSLLTKPNSETVWVQGSILYLPGVNPFLQLEIEFTMPYCGESGSIRGNRVILLISTSL
ncbi:hypothetical protein M6B38_322680 [Iris pallida]|uniref:Uncharacterized protein n=2 Tax=Iris pallida TaxID=29817 RepID=A0AAX6DX41_IRIPA|nr:hypothetical protein M6B38_222965 [Iris pallida]KAJ6825517.1 hypothetical protein M6B38_376540 [Iris pallida]KAJ6837917.1 hypothetical protein M6B38_322680 [Iris pallida]